MLSIHIYFALFIYLYIIVNVQLAQQVWELIQVPDGKHEFSCGARKRKYAWSREPVSLTGSVIRGVQSVCSTQGEEIVQKVEKVDVR